MRKGTGCLSATAVIAALFTILAIAGVVYARGGEAFSPGALNAQVGEEALGGVTSHAQIAGDCGACHAAPWSPNTMADRCMVCHMDVRVQLTGGGGLHGVLYQENPGATCRDCHPEHNGPTASLVKVDAASIPHDRFGFSLQAHSRRGAGLPLACEDCHSGGEFSFDPATCATCHRQNDPAFTQAHILGYGEDCLACHDGVETYGAAFDHATLAFPLTGKHTLVVCTECHLDARSLDDFRATPQDCFSCHRVDEPHGGRFGQDCAACHTTEGWSPAQFDHNLAAFPLEGKHASVACESCHNGATYAERYTATPTDCFSCHQQDDQHAGALGTDCAACHTPQGWDQVNVDHSRFAFPLTGAHTRAACESCHQNGIFKGTPMECVACHQDVEPHQGRFGTDCAACHTTEAWKPATFDHNLARFPLTGAHLNVACESCHIGGVYQGTPMDCYSCHRQDEPHGGRFGTDCAACHTTTAWKPATFDHNLTNFPLTGAHARLDCSRCHGSGAFTALSTACASCHADPAFHRGAFGTNCASCHSTSSWTPAAYRGSHPTISHEGGSGIHHGGASCRTCHPSTVYSYTCLACHSNNQGGEGGGGGHGD